MDRRNFLKNSATAAMAGAAMTIPGVGAIASETVQNKADKTPSDGIAYRFKYNKDGKFKVLQLTDTHYIAGDERSERALRNVVQMLDTEKPDFVIHTGDIIFTSPAEKSVKMILQPLVERRIPFAVALGNHDSDFDLTRSEIFNVVRTMPGNVNTIDDEGIYGSSNDIITLSGKKGVDRILYLFDSGRKSELGGVKGWDYIHQDQIAWYKKYSRQFTEANGGKPVPALAFFHIPVPEYNEALKDPSKVFTGNVGEEPCSPKNNSGLYLAMREMGDVQGIVTGHDHNNDFVLMWRGFFLIYGRFSGCDTVYNDLKPNGARVFEFTEGDDGFRTWVRLYGGKIEQDLYLYPGMKNLTTPREK